VTSPNTSTTTNLESAIGINSAIDGPPATRPAALPRSSLRKDRHGPSGSVKAHWDAERMRFENLAQTPAGVQP
jgi:hypothetical protein